MLDFCRLSGMSKRDTERRLLDLEHSLLFIFIYRHRVQIFANQIKKASVVCKQQK